MCNETDHSEYVMYGEESELFQKWIECYDPDGIELNTIQRYCSIAGKRILDIGCGTGRFLFSIVPIAEHVVGVDPDKGALATLKEQRKKLSEELQKKVEIIPQKIEELSDEISSVDCAVFSWSFYTLNADQVEKASSIIKKILKDDGHLIILQPVGGQFEQVMRLGFTENNDMDEYTIALENINNVLEKEFRLVAKDHISSEFVASSVDFIREALQMFAQAEGGTSKEKASAVFSIDKTPNIIAPYKKNDGKYHFGDEVDMFVFQKRV